MCAEGYGHPLSFFGWFGSTSLWGPLHASSPASDVLARPWRCDLGKRHWVPMCCVDLLKARFRGVLRCLYDDDDDDDTLLSRECGDPFPGLSPQ